MATHDYVIANGTGAAVRSDLNNALAAIVSNNSGSSEPGTTYAYQWWADTNANVLKIRNSSNDAWITLRELDGTMLIEDGSAASPGLSFASDTNSGLFGGSDTIGFATGGVERLEIGSSEVVFNDPSNDVDFRVESNGQTHMLFVDAGNDRVGIGLSSPQYQTHIHNSTASGDTALSLTTNTTGSTNTDGFQILVDGTNSGVNFLQRENAVIDFSINGSGVMRLDNSGRVLAGTSSSSGNFRAVFEGNAGNAAAGGDILLSRGSATPANGQAIGLIGYSDNSQTISGQIQCARDGGTWSSSSKPTFMRFSTAADGATSLTERMRITRTGTLCINDTNGQSFGEVLKVVNGGSDGNCAFFDFTSSDDRASIICKHAGSSGGTNRQHIAFLNSSGGNVGSIKSNGSSTSYNTSSDYRLKENVVNLDGAITRVKQLAPKRFNFLADTETTVDGFLAHEAQAVVPEAVTGTHNEVDDDDNPVYQGIDQSKLVPLLTAALQEAIAKIETLETKVAALEAG